MKNYYEILNVSRKSTQDDIKVSYRNLAKKYHPDNNNGNESYENIFKDLNEAYSTLSNIEEKRKYDKKSAKYKYGMEGGFSDVTYEVNKSKSAINELLYNLVGLIKDPKKNAYTTLNSGKDSNIPIKGENEETEIKITLEEAFFGGDKKIVIKGHELDSQNRTLTVNIPKGIHDGHKIRLAGCGKSGKNGGKSGDLIITVKHNTHKEFELDENDIIKEVSITPAQAVLGCELNINGLDGEVKLKIPSSVQTDKKIKISNRGFYISENNRGNFVAVIKVNVPKLITDEQKKLYSQLLKYENSI